MERGENGRRGVRKKKKTVKVKQIQRDQCADSAWHIQGSARLKALQPKFKVVTRPLEFLILIASTGLRLQHRQRMGGEDSRPLFAERNRQITVYCSVFIPLLFKSLQTVLFPATFKQMLEMLLEKKKYFFSILYIIYTLIYIFTQTTNQKLQEAALNIIVLTLLQHKSTDLLIILELHYNARYRYC